MARRSSNSVRKRQFQNVCINHWVVIANHKAGISELHRNFFISLSEVYRKFIGTLSELYRNYLGGCRNYVGGCRIFYKTCIGTTSEVVVGTMYVGSCRNFYQPPFDPAVLSVVATCGLGRSHSSDLAYLLICVLCWAWWWLFMPCRKRVVAAAQRCLRRRVVRRAELCMWLRWIATSNAGSAPKHRTRAGLERSDFAVRRLPLIFVLK